MIVTGEPVARFVSREIGFGLCPPYSAIGIERDGQVIAGVLFNQYEGAGIHATVAGRGWTLGFIREIGRYVFAQLYCERITATTEQPEVAEYAQRLGGQVEGRLRNHFGPGRDGIVVGILRAEWRYGRFNELGAAEHLQALPSKEA